MAPQETGKMESEHQGDTSSSSLSKANVMRSYTGEIVISGISGRYPESNNVAEFQENLMNKVHMVTTDDRRWVSDNYPDIPDTLGKLKNIDLFDADFFNIPSRAVEVMDPHQRMLLEVVYEAIIDAGESMTSVKGSRTGVYVGVYSSESEHAWWVDANPNLAGGLAHAMLPNRVSFFFDLKGPSSVYDTACSTAFTCLEAAERHMRAGLIDSAVVAATNLVLRPVTSRSMNALGMLSQTGCCHAFDAKGDGFVRAETVSAMILKKAEDAKRIYASVVGTLTNQDGYGPDGIFFPNSNSQEQLIRDVYMNFKVDPNDIQFFECHGPGTQAGDPQETRAICSAVCAKRKEPLLLSSTKTNMGHAECASGIASITKIIIAMNTRVIPANLHFETPNPNIPGLFDGRLKVITEHTPWDGGLVAANSFGMGGSNGHTVFRSYDKKKSQVHPASKMPRLFLYSGRTEEGLQGVFQEAHKHASNVEFHALCEESANTELGKMPFRGATIVNARQEYTEIQKIGSKPREVWFVYSGMGSQWMGMGRSLMALDIFRESIEECASYLKPVGVDLLELLLNGTEECLKTILNPFICIAAVQIGLTDLLKAMGVVPDGIVGHSLGEGGCAYADGCLTKKECILAAYYRGYSVIENKLPPGKMAAVGLTWEEAKQQCPPGVVPACHNAQDNVTISGAADKTAKFMQELSARDVFVREVNSSNISYHSYFMKDAAKSFQAHFEKVVVPKPRSKKWVSTSVPEERWDEPLAQTSGAEYHTNNLLSPVLFNEGLQKIPPNAICIEVAPAGLLQSIIKRTVGPEAISVGLQKRKDDNNLEFFFQSIGRCFSYGMHVEPLKLFAPVQFPVSMGTPGLSSVISQGWDHATQWRVPLPEDYEKNTGSSADTVYELDTSEDSPDRYLTDHQVDGRALFPACGCLVLAWKTLAKLKGVEYDQMPVQLTNVKILQATFLHGTPTVQVNVMPGTGEFQVCENDNLLASGVITSPHGHFLDTDQHTKTVSVLADKSELEVLSQREVYRELILRGYEYGPSFQGVVRASTDGNEADIRWDGQWVSFLDTVLQMTLLARPCSDKCLPVLLETVNIDPRVHPTAPADEEDAPLIPGHYDKVLNIGAAGGVEICCPHTIVTSRRITHDAPHRESMSFVPYLDVRPGERTSGSPPEILRDYADALVELCRHGMKKWLADDKEGHLPHRDHLIHGIEYADKMKNPTSASSYEAAKAAMNAIYKRKDAHLLADYGLWGVSNMVFTEPPSTSRPKLHGERVEILDDPVVASLETDSDLIRLCLDVVSENVNTNCVDILESRAMQSTFFRRAFPSALDKWAIKTYRYQVAHKFIVEDAIDYPVKIVQFDAQDPDNFPEGNAESLDLIILKSDLHYQHDLDKAFLAYSKMLKPGGFFLVKELVERFTILFPIEAYVVPNMGGSDSENLPEGERILNCYFTDSQWKAFFERHDFELVVHRNDGISSSIFLIRKREEINEPPTIVHIDDLQGSWVEEVKDVMSQLESSPDDARLWLVSSAEINGVQGFAASLRDEPGGDKVRCVHVNSQRPRGPTASVPELTADSAEFQELVRKDLVFNVYQDGRWGSHRWLSITEETTLKDRPMEHVFANCLTQGDMPSLKWFDSPLRMGSQNGKLASRGEAQAVENTTCAVYYAGVNPRDVHLAQGAMKKDDLPERFFYKEGVLGVEFSGRDPFGKRVMGLCAPPALSTSVRCSRTSVWSVPDHWGLEDAATVPVAYGTAYLALVINAGIRRGETVFVQAGWTPLGQAAIAVALSYGCEVYTLTRSENETSLLKTSCPQLKASNVFSSTSLTFRRHVLEATGNKGVDIVLSSASSEEILKGSLTVLAKGGRFLDVSSPAHQNAQLAFSNGAQKDSSFQKVFLDALLDCQSPQWTELYDLIQAGMRNGVVKPLKRSVFPMGSIVDAFKTVAEERECEKILIQMRAEERERIAVPPKSNFPGLYRTSFDPNKSYVIVGGLGGLGLESAEWMVLRGARKFLLTSRFGVRTGYQSKKIAHFRNLGARVEVMAVSITTQKKCDTVMAKALELGPVGGLFNLGMFLNDRHFVEHDTESFRAGLEAKVPTTLLLDRASREKPVSSSLDHFVAFSSITGYHGQGGQSSYSFSNSVVDSIVEMRKREGLPALSIQWGAVADTGHVGALGNTTVVLGKWPQRVHNMLGLYDYFLDQKDAAVVSGYVIAPRASVLEGKEESLADQIVRLVGKILGVKDVSTVDGDKTFTDMGMDSLMNVEIKQQLGRDLRLLLNTKEVQSLTFNALRNLVEE